jgi:hypothetical protein
MDGNLMDTQNQNDPRKKGQLTFNAEGNDRPHRPFYSRTLHWPGKLSNCHAEASGATIGRGYDLGSRREADVLSTLILAGIPKESAFLIAKGAGLKGCAALQFVKKNKSSIPDITLEQQKKLFDIVYREYDLKAERFYLKYKKKKNTVDWHALDERVQSVMVDLLYQGQMDKDYVPIFEENSPEKIVALIQRKKHLMQYESGRKRIPYLMSAP